MIVAVEGLDGSGKTTVSKLLVDLIGGTYAALPPPKLKLLSNVLFEDFRSDVRYLYYLSGVVAVAEMERDSEILVADRFVASAHAFHVSISTVLAERLRQLPLPLPDVTFYLDVEEDVRKTRLRDRGTPLDPFEVLLATDDGFRELVAARMRADPHTYVIDTTNERPESIAEAAREICESLGWATGGLRSPHRSL